MTAPGKQADRNVFLFAEQIEFEDLPETSLIRVLDRYWRGLPAKGGLPSRKAILPEDIPGPLLPWILLLDVIHENGGRDYLYRLVGTSNATMIGRDVTGLRATDAFGPMDKAAIVRSYHISVDGRKPTYWRAAVPHELEYTIPVFRGIFPLSTDGETVDKVLAATIPETDDWRV